MAKPEHFNIKPADQLMSQDVFSELMGHLLRWAKAEDFDPSVAGFIKAIEPIYGPGQNSATIIIHLARVVMVLTTDPRFKMRMDPDFLAEVMMAPWRWKREEDRHQGRMAQDPMQTTMNVDQYVQSLVAHVGNLIRNSPTGQLTGEDFQYKFDPTVLVLMRYVKMRGTKDLTFQHLTHVLHPIFKHSVTDLADLTRIVCNAYMIAVKEPAFQLPELSVEDHLNSLLLAPVSGPHKVLGFAKRYTDLRKVEDFYMAIVRHVLGNFAVARVDWCMDNFKDIHDNPAAQR